METLRKIIRQGLIPIKAWNTLVREVEKLSNMVVGNGLAFRKGASYSLTLTDIPILKKTFQKTGKITAIETNACGALLLIEPLAITNIKCYVETASDNGTIDLDINVCNAPGDAGTSLYPSAAKPSIAQDAKTDLDSIPDTKHIEAGKYLQVDVDDPGENAENLTVIIYGK